MKRPFLLLELILALALFSLCILPLVHLPLNAMASNIKTYQQIHLPRLADAAFADIKANLYSNTLSWDEITVPKAKKTLLFEQDVKVPLTEKKFRSFHQRAYVFSKTGKTGKNHEQYRLLTVEICFTAPSQKNFFIFKNRKRDNFSFYYQVFISQKDPSFQPAPVPDAHDLAKMNTIRYYLQPA